MKKKKLVTAKLIAIKITDDRPSGFRKYALLWSYKEFMKWRNFAKKRNFNFRYKIVF